MPPFNVSDPTADTAAPAALLPRMTPATAHARLEALLADVEREVGLTDYHNEHREWVYFHRLAPRLKETAASLRTTPVLADADAMAADILEAG